jgi:hypothetical protein
MAEWNDWPPHNKRGRPPRRKPYVDPGGPRKRPRLACMVVGPAVAAVPVTLAWLLWRWLR